MAPNIRYDDPDYVDPRTAKAREKYVGQKFMVGNEPVTIVKFDKYSDITIRFDNSGLETHTSIHNLKYGKTRDPFANNSPIGFADTLYQYLGCIYKTNEGFYIKVIRYDELKRVYYQFLDNGYIGCTTIQNIKNGEVKNPFLPNKFGGYLGADYLKYRKMGFGYLTNVWNLMIIRAHEPNREYYKQYHSTSAYDNTILDPSWLNFSNYAKWYTDNYLSLNHEMFTDLSVDKDLLYPYYKDKTNGKKCYGPNTCVMMPQTLNILIESIRFEKYDTNKLPKDHPLKNSARYYYKHNGIKKIVLDIILRL